MASGERKLVALLFADLSGFTALASSLDPEEVYAFVRPGLDAMRRIVEEHGASVPHVMGDGFMAVFGVPATHEDDAERAVRAALAVRDHARTLAQGRAGIRFPDVHAGVNSGEVMVAPSSEPGGFSILGDPVNVASRLADLAPPGVVLVAEQTKRRTEHAVRYAEADTFLIEAMAASLVAPPEDAGRLAGEVVRLGRSIGSLRIAGLGLAAGARACLRQGDPARASRQLSAARRTLLAGGVRNEMLEVDFVNAGMHLDRGSWRRVAGPAGRGADGARDSGWVLYESMAPMLVGRALLGAGRPDEAAVELERALASATAAGAAGTATLAAAALEQARVLTGHPQTGPPPATPPDEVEVEAIRSETGGLTALAAGQAQEAAAAFTRAVDHWRQLGLTVWLSRALSLRATALGRAGRPEAAHLLAEASEVLNQLSVPAHARPAVLAPLGE